MPSLFGPEQVWSDGPLTPGGVVTYDPGGHTVIARTWRGWTSLDDADTYTKYIEETGISGYRNTPGNQGAWILRRPDGDRCEFITLSFWESIDAIKGFAGDDVE